jgi:glutamate synthase domain-containing protein 2
MNNLIDVLSYEWSLFVKIILIIIFILLFLLFIYDRYVQRKNQVLINYPVIGRMRYFFYLLRDPMRQYFGDETYYDSFEKIDWINRAADKKSLMYSFSMSKPYDKDRTLFKHANKVLNSNEMDHTLSVTFGKRQKIPFTTKSVIGRSAMSDGAISPEATQAFSKGAYIGQFPINTGEGGLTSNFLKTHQCSINPNDNRFLSIKKGTIFAQSIYKIIKFFLNRYIATNLYRDMVIRSKDYETYSFDENKMLFYRIDWSKPLDFFPKTPLADLPDIIFQMGSGLYGVKNQNGEFDKLRYQKVMKFCKMSEIKIAQGAKQTGGKLLADKVTEAIAYYRNVEPHKPLISPNRFPYANTLEELFDFVGTLQRVSDKPVGIKIVISTAENFRLYAQEIAKRIKSNRSYPDFFTIDGGDGGSATAPREMMSKIGLPIKESLDIVEKELGVLKIRDKIKIIASEKVLTPDDAVELFAYGADFINIARGFMISAGCIRARHCSGAGGKTCPVGLATMDKTKRAKFLVGQKSYTIASYHNQLIEGIKSLLSIMGKKSIQELSKNSLIMRG